MTNTLIIGASAAGLASAACLKKENVDYILLERHGQVAHSWRNHYDRLHLHTCKSVSNLPFVKFEEAIPKYPSRQDVVNYFDNYVNEMGLQPIFNSEIKSVKKIGEHWQTITEDGKSYLSKHIIMATGSTSTPKRVTFPGLETFPGSIIHSSQFKNGAPYKNKKVLVVGFGNSGCEQSICLHEHGAFPALSVRSAVNVLPRDLMGIPILKLGLLSAALPPRIADKINGPLMNLVVGDITKVGLKKSKYGPLEQIQKEGRIPLLDIGTMKLLKEGKKKAYGNISSIQGKEITFEDGQKQDFDAIILATGYLNNLEKFLPENRDRITDLNSKITRQANFGKDGLYFCGFFISPTGMLREIGIEARQLQEI
jgi:indole-3-pyruvate monooxygenase